jgi:hypothetical protein
MQSNIASARMDALSDLAKHFDTSGKSPALFYHPGIGVLFRPTCDQPESAQGALAAGGLLSRTGHMVESPIFLLGAITS